MILQRFATRRSFTLLLVSAISLPLVTACGTAAYHDRMEVHLKKLREMAASQPSVNLSMLYEYIQDSHLPGSKRVNLRIPQCFTKNDSVFHEQEKASRSGNAYLPPRLWPLGVEIPGYYWTYEASVREGATVAPKLDDLKKPFGNEVRWTYSFAFGAIQTTPDGASQAMQTYLQELNVALANTSDANPAQIDLEHPESIKEVEIENQQKEPVRWKVLRLEADMFFTSFQGREEKTWEKKPGVVEIYSTYHNQHLMILTGWWIKELENATSMAEYLPVVASTVKLNNEGLAPPPAE